MGKQTEAISTGKESVKTCNRNCVTCRGSETTRIRGGGKRKVGPCYITLPKKIDKIPSQGEHPNKKGHATIKTKRKPGGERGGDKREWIAGFTEKKVHGKVKKGLNNGMTTVKSKLLL